MKELEIAVQAARRAGETVMKYFQRRYEIKEKSPNNPVTTADLEANEIIREMISRNFPDDGWLSEETKDSTDRLTKPRVWIVDPIDGTLEFIEGVPQFAVSIALVEKDRPIVGVLFNPATDEIFHSVKGKGSFCDGESISLLPNETLENASILVSRTEHKQGLIDDYVPLIGEIRYIGSVAYKLGRLANGAANAYFTVKPKNEWDICAGDLIVHEAGGIFTDKKGDQIRYNQSSTLQSAGLFAGSPELVTQLISIYDQTTKRHR